VQRGLPFDQGDVPKISFNLHAVLHAKRHQNIRLKIFFGRSGLASVLSFATMEFFFSKENPIKSFLNTGNLPCLETRAG
jgi:hypothetical protein